MFRLTLRISMEVSYTKAQIQVCIIYNKMYYNTFMVTPWLALLIKYLIFWNLSTSKLVCSRQLLSSALQNQRITPCLRWPWSVADLRHMCNCPPFLRDGSFHPIAKSLSPPTYTFATGHGHLKHWRCEISQKNVHYPNLGSNSFQVQFNLPQATHDTLTKSWSWSTWDLRAWWTTEMATRDPAPQGELKLSPVTRFFRMSHFAVSTPNPAADENRMLIQ